MKSNVHTQQQMKEAKAISRTDNHMSQDQIQLVLQRLFIWEEYETTVKTDWSGPLFLYTSLIPLILMKLF